jgi:hypothetical protein
MITQLRIRPEVAAAPTFWHWAFNVPGKPLAGMIKMQNMFAAETKRRKLPGHLGLALLLGLVRARHTNNFKTDDTAWKMATTVGTAHASVDTRCEKRVTRLKRRGRLCRGTAHMRWMARVVREGRLSITEDAAEGDLTRRRLELWDTVALGTLGRLDIELRTLEEEFVALK